jgi:hypothetical protein
MKNFKLRVCGNVFCTLLIVCGLLGGVFAQGQEVTGSISGTVSDPSGAAIRNATITLINTDRNATIRTVTTNGAGFYTATSLPLGTYTVQIVDSGFKTESITGLVLHVDDKLTVNRQLSVGSSEQSVTVAADSLRVNLEDATVAGLINGTQTRELVLSTRNYEQLLGLQPGVAFTGATDQIYLGPTNPLGGANTVQFSIGGQRTSANNWTIDGADNVDRGSNLTLLAFPSVDAIAEFKTLRGVYSAEYGRSAAGQVNVVTRSGTNQLHGSAYEFFRNNILNANNYFNKLSSPVTARPPLRYNDYGYTIGGPVYIPKVYDGRNKTFFFFSQEFRRVITYSPVLIYVPTANERLGVFPIAVCANVTSGGTCGSAAGTTKLTTISPTAQAYLKDIYANVPVPNPGPGQDLHGFNYNGRNVYNDTQEFVRIDQAFGQKVNIFYRYLHDSIPTQEPFGYGVGASGLPGVQNTQTKSPGTQQLGHITYVVNPRLLIDGGYAYSYGSIQSVPVGLAAIANSPDIKPALPFPSTLGVVPGLTFTNLTNTTNSGIYNDFNRNHNVFGNITKTVSNHTFIVGATFDRYQKTENATIGNAGTFNFTSTTAQLPTATAALKDPDALYYQSFANFLSGIATGGYTQTSLARTPNLHANTIEAYVQDNWKAKPRLTLNFGVRYSYFAQPTDTSGLLSNFLPSTYVAANAPTVSSSGNICLTTCTVSPGLGTGQPNPNFDPLNGLAYVNSAIGHASPYGDKVGQADTKNFGPRAGLAYDVFGDGKTSFRMGYGLAFDATLFGSYETNVFNNPPLTQATYTYTSLDNPAGGSGVAAPVTGLPSIFSESEHFHTPYSQQYSMDIQQQFGSSVTLDVGYVGSHDTHLLGYIDINSLPVGAARAAGILPVGGFLNSTQTNTANQIRPFKGYGEMTADQTIFTSNYNSLQIAVKKRFKGKSLIDGNYTWQRLLTNSPADRSGAPQDRFNIGQEYGRSILDRTDYASIDFVYELPFYREQRGLTGRLIGGWEVSGIVALDSGLPITVAASGGGVINGTTFADVGGLGIIGASPAGLRPDQLFDPRQGAGLKTRTKWFNTAAFAAPNAAAGIPGNARRGTIIGPGFNREDLGIFRNFRIFEDVNFQLRGEAFNVLNHTNFGPPAATSTTPSTFGTITSTREARILQIGGKLSF